MNPTCWKLAEKHWQEFSSEWYGCDDDNSLLPNSSLSLMSLGDLRQRSLLVRECYVQIFRRVWARAFSSDGSIGAIITGQPGAGVSFLSSLSSNINCFCRQIFARLLHPCQAAAAKANCTVLR
jgi:hypothetical protein